MDYGTNHTSGTTSSSESQSQEMDEGYSAIASSTHHILPSNDQRRDYFREREREQEQERQRVNPFNNNPVNHPHGYGTGNITSSTLEGVLPISPLSSSTTPSTTPLTISNINVNVGLMGIGSGLGSGPASASGMGTSSTSDLGKPHPPFMSFSNRGSVLTLGGGGGGGGASGSGSGSGRESPAGMLGGEHRLTSENSSVSLSAHFLPNKFSSTMLNGGVRKRRTHGKGGGEGGGVKMPKMGGGAEAFRSGEARMPVDGDDDYDGVNIKAGLFATLSGGGAAEGGSRKKMRWNRFKWTLFFANLFLSVYSLIGLIICLLTYFGVWLKVDIIRVGNASELALSTLAMSFGVFTSLIGWAGILLNNRSFLAIHSLLLWITFIFIVAPGYLTYKKHSFNLEGKVNAQWSQDLGSLGRLRIQNQLECCGYFSPFIEATISQTCYSRSVLPGCKLPYMNFERMVLRRWYTTVFCLVPVHLAVMVISLLCANHVTYRFGKGMMPKAYRLSLDSMAVIVDQYANQLAEQYGNDVASEVLQRSRSNMTLATSPGTAPTPGTGGIGMGSTSMNKLGTLTSNATGMGRYDSYGRKEDD